MTLSMTQQNNTNSANHLLLLQHQPTLTITLSNSLGLPSNPTALPAPSYMSVKTEKKNLSGHDYVFLFPWHIQFALRRSPLMDENFPAWQLEHVDESGAPVHDFVTF
jgi:hypothetical protein